MCDLEDMSRRECVILKICQAIYVKVNTPVSRVDEDVAEII